jgi:PAS domain S-box-containing protein
MVRSLDGALQFWNTGAENLYGWSREEVRGQDVHQILQTVFPLSRAEAEDTLRERGSWHGNLTQTTRAGMEIVVACQSTMNREGSAVLEIGRDITAQVRAEEALHETERLAAMGRVAGIIAHEINNPLAAITNIFYLLRNHASLDDEARNYADLAEQELQRVSHIARQTLSFYRESRQPVPVLMSELLEDVLALQERALRDNRIDVCKRYLTASRVQGFPVELRQVMLNLIINGIQAMPKGGVLGICVREATDWIRDLHGIAISIVDTGVGIQPEDEHRLFQPFFSTKATKGTGLGLWISKGIVQKYDGRISCRSYRNQGGRTTCFRVFLPVARTVSPIEGVSGEEEKQDRSEISGNHKTELQPAEK